MELKRIVTPIGLLALALVLLFGGARVAYANHWFFDPPAPAHVAVAATIPATPYSTTTDDSLPVPFPPSPTPEPTAIPIPAPTAAVAINTAPVPTRPAAPAPPPAPVRHFNYVEVNGRGVAIVGRYTDCTGKAAVGWAGAYYDTCGPVQPWVIGHNPILGGILSAGSVIYWDGAGNRHDWRVLARHVQNTYPLPVPGTVGRIQTCVFNVLNGPIENVDYGTY